jgi:hypothetical protein
LLVRRGAVGGRRDEDANHATSTSPRNGTGLVLGGWG